MKRVLAVDDDADILFLIEKFLTDADYDVVTANNGPDALLAFSREIFDIVILDIMMPGMNGLEVSGTIRQQASERRVPVVFVTARTDPEAMDESFRSGGAVFISKPFNRRQLIGAVQSLAPNQEVA